MGGAHSRRKGASYELEVAKQLTAAFGVPVERMLGQARDGGHDLEVGPYVIECKRRKTLPTIAQWMRQCTIAARALLADADVHARRVSARVPHVPIVIAREDAGESLVVMRLSHWLEIAAPRPELADVL